MIYRYTPDVPFSPEIRARIALNAQRLRNAYYQIPAVFSSSDYAWPGDKEGRALLAFVSHYKATGEINPCMESLLAELPARTGRKEMYFGPAGRGETICEQQLSGHSWLLRGLCEHYEQFLDDFSLRALKAITEGLYLPTVGRFATYPDARTQTNDVKNGHEGVTVDGGWKLSADTGCAFLAMDGLSHVYKITKDERVYHLVDEMMEVYVGMNQAARHMHTHSALTAARGMIRMYHLTEEPRYLVGAKDIFDMYVFGHGMTATFQNVNWWRRPDTWTEPCTIVDALIVSCELYKITRKDKYRRLAVRVFHNGFASAQRPNGGAGTDSVVFPPDPDLPHIPACADLEMRTYEATDCCTMRLAEGLWYAQENDDLLYYEMERRSNGELWVVKDAIGRYMCGDLLLGEISVPDGADLGGWEVPAPVAVVDGHRLTPLVKYYTLSEQAATVLKQKILFD